jgi:hypothetical protein
MVSELYTLNQDVIWKSTQINQEFSSILATVCPSNDLRSHLLARVECSITSMAHFLWKHRTTQMQSTM